MQLIQILDIKQFMQLLFQTDILDNYEFASATIQTDMHYTLDGHLNSSFFSTEELETLQLTNKEYLPWHLAKDKIFQIIKGKKTPTQLKIVLLPNQTVIDDLLKSANSSLNSNDIFSISVNILFQEPKLNVTTGISYKIFTMDKEFENEFSARLITLFKSNNITCE